jgi:flagellar basal-body rod modification protein FlgD
MSTAVSAIPTASDPSKAAELAKLPGFTKKAKTTLDQSDFLKLLASQYANQNPLEPQKDTDMIAQMSTFTSVQQMGELVTSLKSFIVSQDFASTQNMLGKYVTATSEKTVENKDGSSVVITTKTSGLVTSVGYDDDGVSVVKIGDKSFSPSDVTAISSSAATAAEDAETETPPTIGSAQSLMGKVVTVTQDQSTTTTSGNPVTVKVSTKGVVTSYGTDAEGAGTIVIGGTTYSLSQVTAVTTASTSS